MIEILKQKPETTPVKFTDIQFNSVLVFEVLRTNGVKDNIYVGMQRALTMNCFSSVEALKNQVENQLGIDDSIMAYRTTLCSVTDNLLQPCMKWGLKVKKQ